MTLCAFYWSSVLKGSQMKYHSGANHLQSFGMIIAVFSDDIKVLKTIQTLNHASVTQRWPVNLAAQSTITISCYWKKTFNHLRDAFSLNSNQNCKLITSGLNSKWNPIKPEDGSWKLTSICCRPIFEKPFIPVEIEPTLKLHMILKYWQLPGLCEITVT